MLAFWHRSMVLRWIACLAIRRSTLLFESRGWLTAGASSLDSAIVALHNFPEHDPLELIAINLIERLKFRSS